MIKRQGMTCLAGRVPDSVACFRGGQVESWPTCQVIWFEADAPFPRADLTFLHELLLKRVTMSFSARTIQLIDQLIADPIGSYPRATVACFDPTFGELPRRRLDPERTVLFLQRLAAVPVPAVLIAASTGNGHGRTVEELCEWFACAASAELQTTVKIALLRPEDGLAANERLLDQLVELDYPIVFFRPGRDLGAQAHDAAVVSQLRPLIQAAAERRFAIGVYSIPDVSGVPLSAAATAQLLATPGGDRIVAAKITEADFEQSTVRYLSHPALTRLQIVQGWDPHLAQALQIGPRFDSRGRQRCGVTSGPMSFAVFQYQHLLAAADQGQWEEVAASQAAVTRLFAAMQDDPRRFADLQRAKWIMGLGQPLTGSIHAEQVERVLTALQNLPRRSDQQRLAQSLDLMQDGPFHQDLVQLINRS
jgi:dihydrodipicolinate synthase/N-acetylneuraminate lyase